jgi:MFS family permease
MVTRFLLGTTEAGFGPGALWYLSTWYTKKETAKRVMVFYFGILFGQACSKLIAFGILHMRGVADRPGWFWLFVLMGSHTCVNGIVFGFLLPDSSRKPYSAFLPQVSLFSKRQMHILKTRVLLDDPMKGQKKKRIGLVSFKKLVRTSPTWHSPASSLFDHLTNDSYQPQLTDWRMWLHFLITLCNSGPTRAFDTYAPTIVRNLGFAALTSNALACVGLFIQIPIAFAFSYISDR